MEATSKRLLWPPRRRRYCDCGDCEGLPGYPWRAHRGGGWDGRGPCGDCGTDTIAGREFYMVTDALWERAQAAGAVDLLCIGCLEARLGRRLHAADFNEAPINRIVGWYASRKSPRLLDRLVSLDLVEVSP